MTNLFGRRRLSKPLPIPNPTADQETALTAMRHDDHWLVSTSDSTVVHLLRKRGWTGEVNSTGDYAHFKIPRRAITIRSKKSVENPPRGRTENFRAPKASGEMASKNDDPPRGDP